MRKPFFKKSHKAWYYEDTNGKQVRLGIDEKKAYEEYGRLIAGQQPATSKATVAELVDAFLVWTQEHKKPQTFDWYTRHCQSFIDHIGKSLRITELKPLHVSAWLKASCKGCNSTTQNGAVRAIARAFNWAVKQGLLPASPIAQMERPQARPRDVFIDDQQWARVIAAVKDDSFLDVLNFLDQTGARPQEMRAIEARCWDRQNRRIVLDLEDSKGGRHRRVIRLNDKATAIIARLALKYPEGKLFRNRHGRALTQSALSQRFAKVRRKTDIAGLNPYSVRHRFCTRGLLAGVGPTEMAVLLGHTSAQMVLRVYSHLSGQDEFLHKKLAQATGEKSA